MTPKIIHQVWEEEREEEKKKKLLLRIAQHLMLNVSFINNLGLYHGKMGVVIFFSHYARYTGESIYNEFSQDLIDEIYEEIHHELPVNFENGYLGIGWGVEYLVSQGFINGDTNSILYEIDKKVMECNVRRLSDMSLNTGLEGIFHYILSRIHDNNITNVFDKQYFMDLMYVADHLNCDLSRVLIDDYKRWYNSHKLNYIPSVCLKKICLDTIPDEKGVYAWKLGLIDGCAGIGLNIMNL